MIYLLTMAAFLLLILFFTKMIIPKQEEKSNKFIHPKTKDNEETFDILWDCEAEEATN